jgi:hypothetical protein
MKYYRTGLPRGGVIPEVRPEDYIGGVDDEKIGLSNYTKLVETPEEWNKYKSEPETQASGGVGETNTCTNQACNEIAERIINYYYQKDLLHSDTKAFLEKHNYIVNGKCNLSESFSAKITNTDPNAGNSLTNVAQKNRTYGFAPEALHPDDFTNYNTFWREPTAQVKAIAKEFADVHFELIHFWIPNWTYLTSYVGSTYDELLKYLPYGLGYMAVPVCNPWDGNVDFCGRTQSDHAVVGVNRKNTDTMISDSYNPYDKTLTNNYLVNACKMVILVPRKKKEVIDDFIKNYLNNRPLNLGLSVPEFGSYYTNQTNKVLDQTQIYRFMELREPYLSNTSTEENVFIELWNKLTQYLKSLTK